MSFFKGMRTNQINANRILQSYYHLKSFVDGNRYTGWWGSVKYGGLATDDIYIKSWIIPRLKKVIANLKIPDNTSIEEQGMVTDTVTIPKDLFFLIRKRSGHCRLHDCSCCEFETECYGVKR